MDVFLDPRVIPRPGVSYVDVTDIKWITEGRKEAAEKMLQALKSAHNLPRPKHR